MGFFHVKNRYNLVKQYLKKRMNTYIHILSEFITIDTFFRISIFRKIILFLFTNMHILKMKLLLIYKFLQIWKYENISSTLIREKEMIECKLLFEDRYWYQFANLNLECFRLVKHYWNILDQRQISSVCISVLNMACSCFGR